MSFLGKTLGKIVGQSKNANASDLKSSNVNQDSQLTLTHLRKVFYEYLHPKGDQTVKDEKLYNILPLFVKAFSQSSLNDINDKFSDVDQFCFACSRLLVNEIGKRVHDDSVLVKFFEMKISDDATDGAGLLNTVNLLASGPPFLIEIMNKCSLPSRLVMCVYLFICLPEPKDSILDHCEFNAKERRILFQKCFHQLLIKLCQNSCTCDELVDGDSLKLLFTIICSTCEQHNVAWRQTATDALLTLTKNFSPKSINYVHGNECIKQSLRSLNPGEICSANLVERADLLITLLTFIRETSISSQMLLDDFRLSSGYKILVDVVLLLEKESSREECRRALRNLFFTIEEFVSSGCTEFKPSSNNLTMFKIEGFQIPQPQGKGRTVRNIYAFQCLLHMFNRVQSNELCMNVLETIKNIYAKDECNYFILESQNLPFYSLDDTSMRVHLKNTDIQMKFIEVLEFIINGLKFVPCKELVSIGLSIQNFSNSKWSVAIANFLLQLIQTNSIYKDAFRELGIVEMLISCLQKFAALLKEKCADRSDLIQIDTQQKELGFTIMKILTCLISHNIENSKLFRQIGGARVAHNMVPYKFCRDQALSIVSTLLLTTAGEDDMSTLLGLMHTAKMEDLDLKNAVLKSLLGTLRESHRTRTVFRKSGGFVYVVSVLISMEGSLSIPARAPWDSVKKQEIFSILKTIMNTLTVSMRYEPANAKFFETEVRWKSLCAAIRLLGCFEPEVKQFPAKTQNFVKRGYDFFETYFCTLDESCFEKFNSDSCSNSDQLDPKLVYICYIMRLLYDTALDAFDSDEFLVDFSEAFDVRPFSRQANRQCSDPQLPSKPPAASIKRSGSFLHNLSGQMDEPFIIHAGAISSMMHLLTSVPTSSYEMAQRLQFNVINLVKNLLKFERNQQIMSSNLFIDDVLFACKHVLNDDTHFLNASIQHIFERLASHYISAKNLKQYMRSGTVFDSGGGGDRQLLVPLSRVKCLISMSSPRDSRQSGGGVAFVEFNMMVEGFGCLFLASIAPQLSNAPSIVAMGMVSVGSDLSVNGGVGSGERVFPPQSGLTYSTWLYIDKFASNANSLHPVRLLTLVKHSKLKDTLWSCLCVYLSAKNRSLFVNTDECLLHQLKHDEKLSDSSVKFNCSELFQEGQWLHLCIVLSRAVLKTSTVSVYVNGKLVGGQKLSYLNSIVVASGPPSAVAVHAVIGTLPMFRCQSAVVWRQAGCHLVEDILSNVTIERIYELGADYIGSFQSLEGPGELVAEEKIVFGVHPSKMFEMTLANFRRVYNKNDSKAIGKQLNIPSNESVTPLRVLSNTAVQLQGASRTVGGVVIGYVGVRVFQPMPVSKSVESLGGAGFLLALVAMATDVEFMYAAVKCLACVLKSNGHIHKEMERMHGYQLLAMLYKRKKALINSHVLNLTFSLAVCDDNGKQASGVYNAKAFECLVCDLDIWYECSAEISRCLHEKYNELLLSDWHNVKLFHGLKMLKRILYSVGREGTSSALLAHALQTVKILITECVHSDDLVTFGHFVASLVADTQEQQTSHVIELRERLLDIVDELIAQQTTNKTYNFQEEIVKVLGFDWFVLFMNRKCVRTTVVKSAKILFTLLLNQQNLNKFITCTNNAAWLHAVNSDTSHTTIDFAHVQAIHGFQLIQANFCKYPHYVQLYYLLFALLFDAHKINDLTSLNDELDLNKICQFVFDKSFDSEQSMLGRINGDIALDLVLIMFSMIRKLMNTSWYDRAVQDYAIILMQIFRFMYHNCDDFSLLSQNGEFLSALILTVYPYEEMGADELVVPTALEIQPFAEAISAHTQAYKTHLSTHPARKLVVDFLRDLLSDSIISKPNCSLIDSILCAIPADAQLKRNQEFTTELLKTVMDHLLCSDLFSESAGQTPSSSQVQALVNFIDRLVDKLYEGMHRRDPRQIIDSLCQLHAHLKKKTNSTHHESHSMLLGAIHRAILFQLSRPCFNLAEQINMLDVLHKIQHNKSLVFNQWTSSDFYACLAYCLLLITNDGEEGEARTLLNSAAQRVWLDVYLSKKSQLEESLKVSLSAAGACDLHELRFLLEEPCARVWSSYWERKTSDTRIHTQIQAKLSRVTSNLSRVVSLKKAKKEPARVGCRQMDEILVLTDINLKLLKESVGAEVAKWTRVNQQKDAYLRDEWAALEADLLRHRALWGPHAETHLDKWKLDFTEGPNRMRKKLLNNTHQFYAEYKIDFERSKRKYKVAQSIHAQEYLSTLSVKSLLDFRQNLSDYLSVKHDLDTHANLSYSTDHPLAVSASDEQPPEAETAARVAIGEQNLIVNETVDETNNVSTSNNHNLITRLLEDGEKINQIYRCARVTGLDTIEGLFLFGKEHFYVLDGYTLVSTKDIVDIDSLANTSTYEPLVPTYATASQRRHLALSQKTCSKFAYEEIREVHNRRYLLQQIAMEIFSNDGRNFLLVFGRKCRQKVYERLIALTPDLNAAGSQSIAGQGRSVQVEQNAGILNALIGEKSVVQRWQCGQITNFQYLMFLNTLAGRSYNDLMQYPVFPWILSDYESSELDLGSAHTFRDLSKPMGAQSADRLGQFDKRFAEWEDPSAETPPYHYGTHYSSAMIVASYLVRMEPFTQIFLKLQGGHFDLADRMFHSVKDAWLSASKNNMADVKELVPEFFYLPEFLLNANKFDLGKKQNGIELNDVVLPPWAKNDPREFVRVHRMALESDYVSAHLNEWIDLIFGYKQQGQPAVDSHNVFHHLFYEGTVDIDQIDDPLKRNAIIGFINNFGQIPKQLFKKPHPVKKLASSHLIGAPTLNLIGTTVGSIANNLSAVDVTGDKSIQPMFIHHLKSLKPGLQPVKELKSQIGQIVCTDKAVLVVEQNKFLIGPTYQRYIAWGYADQSIRIGYTDYEKSYTTFENVQFGAVFCCCATNATTIVTAGQSCVVNVWQVNRTKAKKMTLKTRLYGHMDTVTCMAVSNSYHMLVTGSRDQSCIVWDINRWSYVRQLSAHHSAVSAICINELTGDIATASASFLYLWSINGELLASMNTIAASRNHVILCVQMSHVNEWDANNVILTGATDGVVRMWSLGYVQVCQNDSLTAQSTFDCSQSPLEDGDDDLNHSPIRDQNILFKTEESDKSNDLDDDFVLIDSFQSQTNKNVLKPGHKWKRELIFRSKLTMHTSYDRKDNYEPASVTALAISKDHKTIYVGDSRGRVFSWVCIENPGRTRADHWVKDDSTEQCRSCNIKFSFSERKHHCRDCGCVFCNQCTKYEIDIPKLNINKPVRVCQQCYSQNFKADTSLNSSSQSPI